MINHLIHLAERALTLSEISVSFPDAVHLQHSFAFMKALTDYQVLYKSQVNYWCQRWGQCVSNENETWRQNIHQLIPHGGLLVFFGLALIFDLVLLLHPQQIYPDSNHYLEDVRMHLYRSLEADLNECFDLEEDADIVGMQTMKSSKSSKQSHWETESTSLGSCKTKDLMMNSIRTGFESSSLSTTKTTTTLIIMIMVTCDLNCKKQIANVKNQPTTNWRETHYYYYQSHFTSNTLND